LQTICVFISLFLFFGTITLLSRYAATPTVVVLANLQADLLRKPFRSASLLPAATSDAIRLLLLVWKLLPAGINTLPVTRLGRRHPHDAIAVNARIVRRAFLDVCWMQTESAWTVKFHFRTSWGTDVDAAQAQRGQRR